MGSVEVCKGFAPACLARLAKALCASLALCLILTSERSQQACAYYCMVGNSLHAA